MPSGKSSEEGRRALALHAAFQAGDMAALRTALDDPSLVPNGVLPPGFGTCLTYAIYHSPLRFIEELLRLGADANFDDGDGFPPLIAALASGRNAPEERHAILALLLAHDADPNQRDFNDETPLHRAVADGDVETIRVLLKAGADPKLATRIDDFETPEDVARRLERFDLLRLLQGLEP